MQDQLARDLDSKGIFLFPGYWDITYIGRLQASAKWSLLQQNIN